MVLEQTVAWCLLFIGTSLIFRTHLWIELCKWIDSAQSKETLFFSLSGFTFLIGIIIVNSHNFWELSPLVIVTLIGWISILKSFIFIFFPKIGILIYRLFFKQETSRLIWIFRFIGGLYMLLGVTTLSYIS